MYVTVVPNRSSPPAVLLRESFREGAKVRTRTLANLTHWPDAKVEALKRVLRGETLVRPADRFEIERALPHGHVAAVLGTVRAVGLDRLLPRRPERLAKLALALIVARVVEPATKLATARQLSEATASHSLGAVLGLGGAKLLYGTTNWNAGGFLPGFDVTWATVAIGAVIALALMLASGIIPAVRAARMPVVTALRNIG